MNVEHLQKGELIGDKVPGTNCVFLKVRGRDSDIPNVNCSGCHLIYFLKSPKKIQMLSTFYLQGHQNFSDRRSR